MTHESEKITPALQYQNPHFYDLRLAEDDEGLPDMDMHLERTRILKEYGNLLDNEYCIVENEVQNLWRKKSVEMLHCNLHFLGISPSKTDRRWSESCGYQQREKFPGDSGRGL